MLSPLPRKSTLANTCLSSKTHIKDPVYWEIFLSSPQMQSRPLPPLGPFGTLLGTFLTLHCNSCYPCL